MSHVIFHADATSQRLTLADGSASARLVPKLGLQRPRYHFHIGRVVHAAQELELFRVQTTLLLGNDLTGESELCDFSLDLSLQGTHAATAFAQLVRAAQDRLREAPHDHGDWLVVELPGWRDAQGRSPFWQALGSRFYPGDPEAAERQHGADWRSHLAALLPRQSIYLSFLGPEAEARLGQAHPDAQPALAALQAAGFTAAAQVRIDDAGPVLAWRVPR